MDRHHLHHEKSGESHHHNKSEEAHAKPEQHPPPGAGTEQPMQVPSNAVSLQRQLLEPPSSTAPAATTLAVATHDSENEKRKETMLHTMGTFLSNRCCPAH